jgi:hypothetical protein
MLTFFIKFISAMFFSFLAVDSFFKIKRIRKEVEDDLLNPIIGATLRKRALRNGLMFALFSILSAVAIFFRIAPLGE